MMEIKVTMLGTAGSSPTKDRGMPSVAITYDGNVLLFDCGEGTQMQMLKYGINISRIRAVFLTHAHGDHIIGIAGMIRTMALNNRTDPLTIFIPKGHEDVIKKLLYFDRALIGYKIDVKGIRSGEIYKGRNFTVSAFKLSHNIETCGYVFKENDKRRFLEDKCKKLGIKGEMHKTLLENGKLFMGNKMIKLNDVTKPQVGKKVVYASDTVPVKETVAAAKNADLLIHESSYIESEKDLAKERKHSVAKEVAQLAKKAGVKQLLLTHISARYGTPEAVDAEARKVFRNARVAKDGEVIIV